MFVIRPCSTRISRSNWGLNFDIDIRRIVRTDCPALPPDRIRN